ncbi:hypothetical protein MHN80_13345 [Gordonia McavH-238-E]|uniref:LppU/SCO3897 family protein n=1 Tax=Gordonia sp. McavH-238-E TaxID=2917736 RepID=UPI001EF47D20|nr:hypothetical protein [Gordonia sp. McavH-238-E]MCG7633295.1 hypothetical protein [Gordonia sp. McavH-238-E]
MTNSPYQPGDPRYGPQPQPGQYPPQAGYPPPNQHYGAPPPNQVPYGTPPPYQGGPMPGGMYPPGPPFPPPPKKKRTGLWVVLGVVGVLLLIVIAGGVARVLLSASQGGGISDVSDVEAGECIVVTAEPDTLKAKEVSCGDTDFHYVVAEKSITQGLCGANYSRYWVAGQDGALCLAPVYQEGRCYYLPAATTGTALAEIREIECGAPVSGGTNIRVDTKASGEPECPDADGSYFADKPRPVGYCFSVIE